MKMRNRIIIIAGMVLIALISIYLLKGSADPNMTLADKKASELACAGTSCAENLKFIAYYFHGNYRCVSCRNIEQYTKEAIEKYFQAELSSGKLTFSVINVEQAGNQHYVNDYQLYTKSVILSKVVDGKEVEYKNLDKVWTLLNNKEKFYAYVQGETGNFLGATSGGKQ